jgi:hypothetical protein
VPVCPSGRAGGGVCDVDKDPTWGGRGDRSCLAIYCDKDRDAGGVEKLSSAT